MKTMAGRVRLSKTSKMPCLSWSLEAMTTCPGSRNAKGNLVQVCQGCYADTGFYKMKGAITLRQYNREDWKRPKWEEEMIQALIGQPYFRWFDSGDVYHPALAEKIYWVMKKTSWCKHWLPTRSYKIKKIRPWLTRMKRLANVSVRYSSDNINRFNRKVHGSMVYNLDTFMGKVIRKGNHLSIHGCPAYKQGGKCGDCRACWDKTIEVVGYPGHGVSMKKVLDTIV